jgi:hypothetical protein
MSGNESIVEKLEMTSEFLRDNNHACEYFFRSKHGWPTKEQPSAGDVRSFQPMTRTAASIHHSSSLVHLSLGRRGGTEDALNK